MSEPARISNTCLKTEEKNIGIWVALFPLGITLLFFFKFLYDMSLVVWDFVGLSWYGWIEFIFLLLGIIVFVYALMYYLNAKKCE